MLRRARREIEDDEFFGGMLDEMVAVQEHMEQVVLKSKGRRRVDTGMADLIRQFCQEAYQEKKAPETIREFQDLLKLSNPPERLQLMIKVKAQVSQNDWSMIEQQIYSPFMNQISHSFLAELCVSYDRPHFAVALIQQLKDKDEQIALMIDLGLWQEAINFIHRYKRGEYGYLEEIRSKAPSSIVKQLFDFSEGDDF